MKPRLFKRCFSELASKKRSVAEITLLKPEGDPKLAALLKIDSKHFTVTKGNISESTICNRRHTQITGYELAIFKTKLRQIGTGEVALVERAVFIVSFWKWTLCIIFGFER